MYIDDSDNPDFETEIFVDADYKHFPLRDYSMTSLLSFTDGRYTTMAEGKARVMTEKYGL